MLWVPRDFYISSCTVAARMGARYHAHGRACNFGLNRQMDQAGSVRPNRSSRLRSELEQAVEGSSRAVRTGRGSEGDGGA